MKKLTLIFIMIAVGFSTMAQQKNASSVSSLVGISNSLSDGILIHDLRICYDGPKPTGNYIIRIHSFSCWENGVVASARHIHIPKEELNYHAGILKYLTVRLGLYRRVGGNTYVQVKEATHRISNLPVYSLPVIGGYHSYDVTNINWQDLSAISNPTFN
jgi:hypothetical protein